MPCLDRFDCAAIYDHTFLKKAELEKGSYVVLDKPYNDYLQSLLWTKGEIYFVTRQKDNLVYKRIEEFNLSDTTSIAIKDDRITVEKEDLTIPLRPIS